MNFKVGCTLKQPSNVRNETEVNKEFTGFVKLRAVPPFPSFSAKSVARVKKISEKKIDDSAPLRTSTSRMDCP